MRCIFFCRFLSTWWKVLGGYLLNLGVQIRLRAMGGPALKDGDQWIDEEKLKIMDVLKSIRKQ